MTVAAAVAGKTGADICPEADFGLGTTGPEAVVLSLPLPPPLLRLAFIAHQLYLSALFLRWSNILSSIAKHGWHVVPPLNSLAHTTLPFAVLGRNASD
jgi:hypothetical protein